ncbi:retinol dehydrogenase 11-like [Mya arenaria]|uniref:retinol dehydrogenase 11-like n=1 Tax=Mya arenaria TaxID=6604 RepID=UPI0022E8E749|nr:retinol dehydrogenase 11-like [Mya arenaria]
MYMSFNTESTIMEESCISKFFADNCGFLTYGVIGVCAFLTIRQYMQGPKCRSTLKLAGKTVLITGANTGIGKETAKDLAKRGARVLLACRDLTRAQKAASDIINSTGNTNVVVYKLDLSSLKSVRECAEEVKKNEQRLDILINNAGVMWTPQWKTEDGFDMQMGTNHLGHFLLTNLLLDLVKKSAPSRIVTVSSLGHRRANLNLEDINCAKSFSTVTAYANSKLANILFTRELAKRLEGTNVTAVSLHPGAIASELGRHIEDRNLVSRLLAKVLYYPFLKHLIKTPTAGAQTTLYCALDPDVENHPGKYFSDCAVKEPTKAGQDDVMASKLWALSEKLTGLKK